MKNSRLLLWPVLIVGLLMLGMGCGQNSNPAILASCPGITVTGVPGSAIETLTLSVSPLDRHLAETYGIMPAGRVFLVGGDFTPNGASFIQPITVNFTLPRKIFAGEPLELFADTNGVWTDTGIDTVVGPDGLATSFPALIFYKYALFLDQSWGLVTSGTIVMASKMSDMPASDLDHPATIASGNITDEPVIEATMKLTGYNRSDSEYTLKSWTSAGEPCQILELTSAVFVTRNTGTIASDKLGRWYSPAFSSDLPLPEDARQIFALPKVNEAYNCTLYKFKPGLQLIYGVCSNMGVINPEKFGPYATGGGYQFYAPSSTKWVVDHPEVNTTYNELVSELRWIY